MPETEKDVWRRVTDMIGDTRTPVGPAWSARLRDDPKALAPMLARRKLAAKMGRAGGSMLELGCGEGVGVPILAEHSSAYTGVDADGDALTAAESAFGRDDRTFANDARGTFDTVVGLEIADVDDAIERVRGHLSPDGIAILGAPTGAGLADAMRERFAFTLTFGQTGAVVHPGAPGGDHQIVVGTGSDPKPRGDAAKAPAPDGGAVELGRYIGYWFAKTPRRALNYASYYGFAAGVIGRGRRVLDLGCSEGMGTWLLARECGWARGMDLDEDAIEVAKTNWVDPSVEFVCGDFFDEEPQDYDALTSFDVVEHILPENVDAFMDRIAANLGPDGIAVIGTPSLEGQVHASPVSRAGHVNCYSGDRLEGELRERFRHVFMFAANDELVHTGFLPMAHYLIAVGYGPRR
jgi:2-polyprenyl-3-methyl-5-hydroxy-6-metoxy-1,4-benzoquinol methylase